MLKNQYECDGPTCENILPEGIVAATSGWRKLGWVSNLSNLFGERAAPTFCSAKCATLFTAGISEGQACAFDTSMLTSEEVEDFKRVTTQMLDLHNQKEKQ